MTALPSAQLIDSLGIAMGAGEGIAWAFATQEQRQVLRRMANAALMGHGAAARAHSAAYLAQALEALQVDLKRAAVRIEEMDRADDEDLVQAIYRGRATVEVLAAILAGAEQEEAV